MHIPAVHVLEINKILRQNGKKQLNVAMEEKEKFSGRGKVKIQHEAVAISLNSGDNRTLDISMLAYQQGLLYVCTSVLRIPFVQ
mmetsp:Transcript_37796/g.97524  ORF Transcript_37796/g.97524 Transcript_37796/m.97524 type:complete len:84 (-) Transcript_37796:97-348(-)